MEHNHFKFPDQSQVSSNTYSALSSFTRKYPSTHQNNFNSEAEIINARRSMLDAHLPFTPEIRGGFPWKRAKCNEV